MELKQDDIDRLNRALTSHALDCDKIAGDRPRPAREALLDEAWETRELLDKINRSWLTPAEITPWTRTCQCGENYIPKTPGDGLCPRCMLTPAEISTNSAEVIERHISNAGSRSQERRLDVQRDQMSDFDRDKVGREDNEGTLRLRD